MPCVKGRAQHVLCKPDCTGEQPCDCKGPEAFSCFKLCKGDDLVNTQLSLEDARDIMCNFLTGQEGILTGSFDAVSEVRTAICENNPPYFNCPLTISIQGAELGPLISGPTGTVGPYTVVTIDKGVCSGGDTGNLESGDNVVYNVFVDGIQCENSFFNVS